MDLSQNNLTIKIKTFSSAPYLSDTADKKILSVHNSNRTALQAAKLFRVVGLIVKRGGNSYGPILNSKSKVFIKKLPSPVLFSSVIL